MQAQESPSTGPVTDEEGQRLQKQYQTENSWLTALMIIARVLDLLSSSGTIAMMGLNLAKYYQTHNDHNGTTPLWAGTTFTWPNYLSLAAAAITFLAACVVLISYCVSGKDAATRIDNRRAWLAKLLLLIHVCVVAAAAIAMYKTRGNGNSLSGQTCGAPDSKPLMFPEINFDKFCLMQDIGNGLLLVKVFTGLVGLFAYIIGFIDKRTKKKLDRRSKAGKSGLVSAPVGDAKNKEVERFVGDTKYTNIEESVRY